MSQKLLSRWKKLSNDFSKNTANNKQSVEILKEAIELQTIADRLEVKIHKNNLSRACQIFKEAEHSVGTHLHMLERENKKTKNDGKHRHVFILSDGTYLLTEEGGEHSHAIGSEYTDLITESGKHSHEVILPSGEKVRTLDDTSEHDHQLKVFDSCVDGIHSHSITLKDGTILESLWGGEQWDYLRSNQNKNNLPPVIEQKSLAQQLFDEQIQRPSPENNCLDYFDAEKLAEFCKEKKCYAQKIPYGEITFISKNGNLVFIAGTQEVISDELLLYFSSLKTDFTFEVVLCKSETGYKIYLLDVIQLGGVDYKEKTYFDRLKTLQMVMITFGGKYTDKISLIESKKIATMSQIKDLENSIKDNTNIAAIRVIEEDCKNTVEEKATKILKMENKSMAKNESFTVKKENLTDDLILVLAALGLDPVKKEDQQSLPEKLKNQTDDKKSYDATIIKSDDDKRLVTGVVLEPMFMDLEADIMTPEAVEEAAHMFLKDHRVIGFRHRTKAQAVLVESYIAPVDFELNGQQVKKGSWIITVFVVDDELWVAIKRGEIQGFSVGGYGQRTELT